MRKKDLKKLKPLLNEPDIDEDIEVTAEESKADIDADDDLYDMDDLDDFDNLDDFDDIDETTDKAGDVNTDEAAVEDENVEEVDEEEEFFDDDLFDDEERQETESAIEEELGNIDDLDEDWEEDESDEETTLNDSDTSGNEMSAGGTEENTDFAESEDATASQEAEEAERVDEQYFDEENDDEEITESEYEDEVEEDTASDEEEITDDTEETEPDLDDEEDAPQEKLSRRELKRLQKLAKKQKAYKGVSDEDTPRVQRKLYIATDRYSEQLLDYFGSVGLKVSGVYSNLDDIIRVMMIESEPCRIVILETGLGKFNTMVEREKMKDLIDMCSEECRVSVFYSDACIKMKKNDKFKSDIVDWHKWDGTPNVAYILTMSNEDYIGESAEAMFSEEEARSTKGVTIAINESERFLVGPTDINMIRAAMTTR